MSERVSWDHRRAARAPAMHSLSTSECSRRRGAGISPPRAVPAPAGALPLISRFAPPGVTRIRLGWRSPWRGLAPWPQSHRQRHPSIYLLGDHLDAALAMGEDLLTEKVALDMPAGRSPLRDWMRQNRDLNDFLTTVRTLEYAMTARLLQARKRAEELKRSETRLKPLIALFVAGTAPLADAAAELGDTDARDFQSARCRADLPAQPRPAGCGRGGAGGAAAARRSARIIRSPAASGSAPCWIWSPPSSIRSTCCSISTPMRQTRPMRAAHRRRRPPRRPSLVRSPNFASCSAVTPVTATTTRPEQVRTAAPQIVRRVSDTGFRHANRA